MTTAIINPQCATPPKSPELRPRLRVSGAGRNENSMVGSRAQGFGFRGL